MERERLVKVSGLNITVHTKHRPEEYVELWKALHRMRRSKLRGSTALTIGTAQEYIRGNPEDGIFGHFYRFVDINPEDPWFDIDKHEPADEEDVALVNIPAALKPNLEEIPYFFHPRSHRLYFKSGGSGSNVTAGLALALIEHLSSFPRINARFAEVDVTIITSKAAIEEMLAWPQIRRIALVLKKPNPTEYSDDEEFYARLERRGLKREEHVFVKAQDAPTISIDAELREMIDRSVTDGVYMQTGVDPVGDVREVSSKSYPMVEPFKYDPELETESQSVWNFVKMNLARLK